ncbi:hypothetical protein CIPAW_01G001500 [Carya illinoinensis]|uniref:Uncharacterized protein n=1 Tax=Carya illinoinensis TaxID=32201 RepID=A0A8T1RJJ9_CARIL|nr:hypothetical protein CIPAW_01G001500 [Carya illinoinensis]
MLYKSSKFQTQLNSTCQTHFFYNSTCQTHKQHIYSQHVEPTYTITLQPLLSLLHPQYYKPEPPYISNKHPNSNPTATISTCPTQTGYNHKSNTNTNRNTTNQHHNFT